MLRLLMMTALCAGLLLAVAGNAAATILPPEDATNANGNEVIVEDDPVETFYELDAVGKRVPYKCRSAKVAYVKKTLLGSLAFKWWMKRSWCWRPSRRLVSVGTSTYVTDMNGFNDYHGVIESWSNWFTWCCSEPRSGHTAFRQAKFSNCIVKYGCLSTTYPWIRMSVRGDGTYTYSIGD